MEWVRELLTRVAGPIEDEVVRDRAQLLAVVCLLTLLCAVPILFADVVVGGAMAIPNFSMMAITVLVLLILRSGRPVLGAWVYVVAVALVGNTAALLSGGYHSGAYAINAFLVVMAGVMLRGRGVVLVIAVALVGAALTDRQPVVIEIPNTMHLVILATMLTATGVVVIGLVRFAESTVQQMVVQTRQLKNSIADLERTNISRDYMASVLGALREFIVVTDADRAILSVDGAVETVGQWSAEELLGQPLDTLFEGISEGVDGGRDVVLLRRDGTRIPVLVSMGELPQGQCVWAASDISALVSTTTALRQAHDRARAASAAKSSFLANMSHELRTPLNAIIGYGELLSDDIEDASMLEDLSRIGTAARSLLDLINGVLDLSKVESGKISIENEDVEMDDILQPLISVMEPIMYRRQLSFEVRGEGRLGPPIVTDARKLHQVLLNLLSNAAKFTHSGGVKLIVERWERSRLPWVRFTVEDTGIGMDNEDLGLVFEPFTQARANDQNNPQGTGLGLSICRAFVDMMGGQIYAESVVGQGSRFVVELPAARYSALTPMTPSTALPDGVASQQRVLVIDDDADFLEFAGRILVADGRQVVCSVNAQDGLVWADRFVADVIVLDISMPLMSGWAFVVRLRKTKSAGARVLVVSGAGDEGVAEALGCAGFMLKPVDPKELVHAVVALLEPASLG